MHAPMVLQDLVILLALSIPIVALAQRLKTPPIVGFLLVGVLVGPHSLGLISQPAVVQELAEVGVVLLLFTIGLELSLSRILKMGGLVLQGGALQVALTLAAAAGVARVALGSPANEALFWGALIALSSTAIVLKAYSDRGELDTPPGRVVVSILLFQDLCVVPFMLLVPVLAGTGLGETTLGEALFASGLVVAGMLFAGRFLVPWLLGRIVLFRNRELFTLCVGFLGLGAAYVTASFGLSLALGAFLAGLVISESEYGLQALSDVLPFRDTFSGIFFTSVGMLLDVTFVAERWPWVAGATAVVLILKTLLATGVVRTLRRSFQASLASGLSLAQVGEFSFVLASVGLPLGLLGEDDYQLFLAASVSSMLVAPFLISGSRPIAERAGRWLGRPEIPLGPREEAAVEGLRDHAIILGYGLSGRHLTRVLRAADLPYVVLEQNGQLVRRAREEGVRIFFGDGARREVLEHAGIVRARVLVIAIASPSDERRAVSLARSLNPSSRIVVRTRYVKAIDDLMRLGATEVVVEEFEATLELFARVLEFYEIPANTIQRELDTIRSEHYRVLRTPLVPELDPLGRLGIHRVLKLIEVEEGSRAIGESPVSLELRRRTGAVVIAVVRDGSALYQSDPSFEFRRGDTVVLVGDPEALERGADPFRAQVTDRS